jgi:hypothetical protein
MKYINMFYYTPIKKTFTVDLVVDLWVNGLVNFDYGYAVA